MTDRSEARILMPATLEEALRHKSEWGDDARLVAGGTDLLLQTKMGKWRPGAFIRLPCLDQPAVIDGDVVLVSALTSLTALVADPVVSGRLPLLAEAMSRMGSPQIRNIATLGGNLGNASPAADSAPPLMVYEARVHLASTRGTRSIAVEDFFLGPGKTVVGPDEVIVELAVPLPGDNELVYFNKFGPRGANVISSANFGVRLVFDDNGIENAFLAAGSVAPRPLRLVETEKALKGKAFDELAREDETEALVAILHREVAPISDVRGSAWYKARVVEQCFRYVLDMTREERC